MAAVAYDEEEDAAMLGELEEQGAPETIIRMDEPENIDADEYRRLLEFKPTAASTAAAAAKSKKKKKRAGVVEFVNSILPPRLWEDENGNFWKQTVSIETAEREDVLRLQERLDNELQDRQARESGLCPVREQLYGQCLDELMRQVAIERPETGLLLQRVRDETRMTIAAYRTLYNSSITFGMRKTMQAEQGNADLQNKIKDLKARKAALEAQLQEQKNRCETVERRTAEKKAAQDKQRIEEKDFLKHQAQHLEHFIKTMKN